MQVMARVEFSQRVAEQVIARVESSQGIRCPLCIFPGSAREAVYHRPREGQHLLTAVTLLGVAEKMCSSSRSDAKLAQAQQFPKIFVGWIRAFPLRIASQTRDLEVLAASRPLESRVL